MSKKRIQEHRENTWLYALLLGALVGFTLVHNFVIPLDDIPHDNQSIQQE